MIKGKSSHSRNTARVLLQICALLLLAPHFADFRKSPHALKPETKDNSSDQDDNQLILDTEIPDKSDIIVEDDNLETKKERLIRRVIEGNRSNKAGDQEKTDSEGSNKDIEISSDLAAKRIKHGRENDSNLDIGQSEDTNLSQNSENIEQQDRSQQSPKTQSKTEQTEQTSDKLNSQTTPNQHTILEESIIDKKLNSNSKNLQSKDLDLLSDIIFSNTYKVDSGTRFSGLKITQTYSSPPSKPQMRTCYAKVPQPLNLQPPAHFKPADIQFELAELHRPELFKLSPSKVEVAAHLGSVIFEGKVFVLYKAVLQAAAQTEAVGIGFPMEMQILGREVTASSSHNTQFHGFFETTASEKNNQDKDNHNNKNSDKKKQFTESEPVETDNKPNDDSESSGTNKEIEPRKHQPSTGVIISILFEESQYADPGLYQLGFGTGEVEELLPGESKTVPRFNLRDFLGDATNKFMFWKSRNALLARTETIPNSEINHASELSKDKTSEGGQQREFQKTRFCSNPLVAGNEGEEEYLDVDEVSWDETLWMTMFVTIDVSKLQIRELKKNLNNVFKTEMKKHLKKFNYRKIDLDSEQDRRATDLEYSEPVNEEGNYKDRKGTDSEVHLLVSEF